RDDRVTGAQLGRDLLGLGLRLRLGLLALPPPDARLERPRLRRAPRDVDRPALLGHERLDLFFALADQAHGDRLHATRGQTALHLVPQDRADLVADDAIEDATRLLRVRLVHVDLARRCDRGRHTLLRDLVDQDALEV